MAPGLAARTANTPPCCPVSSPRFQILLLGQEGLAPAVPTDCPPGPELRAGLSCFRRPRPHRVTRLCGHVLSTAALGRQVPLIQT